MVGAWHNRLMAGRQSTLQKWLASLRGEAGLVITDVVGSTDLLFGRETVQYTRLLRKHRSRAQSLIRELEGRLVDGRGDELFAAFPTATAACTYAEGLMTDSGHPELRVRAGCHFGPVRSDGRKLVGRSVHFTARISQHAGDSEIWLSEEAKRRFESESPDGPSTEQWMGSVDCELKGMPSEQRLWRLR